MKKKRGRKKDREHREFPIQKIRPDVIFNEEG